MPNVSVRLATTVIFLGFSSLFLYSISWSEPQITRSPGPISEVPSFENLTRKNPWCQPHECSAGRWEPRQPAFSSLDDFRAAYANRLDRVWKGCRAIPDPTGKSRDSADQSKVDEDRLMQVMSWTWTPYAGKLRPWDPEEFIVRLLKSPGGLILIGGA